MSLPVKKEKPIGNYFAQARKTNLEFIKTGCILLDCSLGGGWPLGRMSNIIGDFSSSKTLLAIEAMANFSFAYDGEIHYLEAEAAFDRGYAEALGMPVRSVQFVGEEQLGGEYTIEAWFEHLEGVLVDAKKSKKPGLYIVDSLDALSDRAEKERKITDGSYGGSKPKKIGELFRRLVKEVEQSKLHLMIISQIRDNIGVAFGNKHVRTGGKAMDFYASHCVWLTKLKQIKKVSSKMERVIGVNISAEPKKNKVALPFRKVEFPVLFGYGVDDIAAMWAWVEEAGCVDVVKSQLKEIGLQSNASKASSLALAMREIDNDDVFNQCRSMMEQFIVEKWTEIETSFQPTTRKYR